MVIGDWKKGEKKQIRIMTLYRLAQEITTVLFLCVGGGECYWVAQMSGLYNPLTKI